MGSDQPRLMGLEAHRGQALRPHSSARFCIWTRGCGTGDPRPMDAYDLTHGDPLRGLRMRGGPGCALGNLRCPEVLLRGPSKSRTSDRLPEDR